MVTPYFKDNAFANNGAEPVWVLGRIYTPGDYEENFFGPLPAKKAIRFIDAAPEKPTEKAGKK